MTCTSRLPPKVPFIKGLAFKCLVCFTVPSAAPALVRTVPSSKSIIFLWEAIECIQRNGHIYGYEVKFQRDFSWIETHYVQRRNYNASGLIPNTRYTFKVAGVNGDGTGPFSNLISLATVEDGKDL